MVPIAAHGHTRKHVTVRKRNAVVGSLPVSERGGGIGSRILEDIVEPTDGENVSVDEEDFLVLSLLEDAQFRHDVLPAWVADFEPVRQGDVLGHDDDGAVFTQSGPFALRDFFCAEDDEGDGGVGAGGGIVHQLVADDAGVVEIDVFVVVVVFFVLPIVC